MERKHFYVFMFSCLLLVNCADKKSSSTVNPQLPTKENDKNTSVFKHPGILNSNAQILFVKQKIKNGEEPWKTAFKQLKDSPFSSPNYQTKPYEVVDCVTAHKNQFKISI